MNKPSYLVWSRFSNGIFPRERHWNPSVDWIGGDRNRLRFVRSDHSLTNLQRKPTSFMSFTVTTVGSSQPFTDLRVSILSANVEVPLFNKWIRYRLLQVVGYF